MIDENSVFLKNLHNNYNEIEKLIEKNKYILLLPRKILIEESLLTKKFYFNHIYYIDKYNERLYINLNGKVLKYDRPKFSTYLGWTKDMSFTVIDSFNLTTVNISCLQLDNVCDESHYIDNNPKNKQESQLKKFENFQDYLRFYKNFEKMNDNYKKIISRLEKFVKEMQKNYIFMKGQENKYSRIFMQRAINLINKMAEILKNPKDDANLVFTIASELVDSLIFDKLYSYIFPKIVEFNANKEKKFHEKLQKNLNKYEIESLKLDPVFNNCKFLPAIEKLDSITKLSTVFEKINLLTEVNNLINEEAKNSYEANNKENYVSQGDMLFSFWVYVIAHCKTYNIISESHFLNLFRVGGLNESDYVCITFIGAVDNIVSELKIDNDNEEGRYIEPNILEFTPFIRRQGK